MVVDVSGSMESALPTVKKTIAMVAEALQEGDRIAIVAFGDKANVLLPLSSPKLDSIPGIIEALKINGCTNIMDGMEKGLDVILKSTEASVSRLSMLMLLSDGAPNVGITTVDGITNAVKNRVAGMVNLPTIPQLVIHSFGYTTGHNPAILRSLTLSGNGGSGLYYFVDKLSDISTAIGDCLGSVKKVTVFGLRLSATPLRADGQPLDGWVCFFYDGKALPSLTEPPTPLYSLGYLAANEQRNVVVVAQPLSAAKKAASVDTPTSVLVRVFYCDALTREEKSTNFQAVILQGGSSSPDLVAQQLHVQTHVLRLRVSNSLGVISAMSRVSNIAPLEQLHELILQTIATVQETASSSPVASLMEDESLLLSLEKDLGQALEAANNSLSSKDKARMQQYSHEHATQKSASNATELRATYSTPEQAAMRAQFGDGAEQKLEAIAKDEKAKVVLEQPGLSPEEKTKRLIVDEDVVCFVSLENWRTAHIGIGLLVQPMTMRERYKRLIPQIEFAQDYISADSYNQGARSLATKGVGDRDKAGAQHSVVTSSTRGRINAWLPLYVNATNWQYVKHWAPSAFSIIATQVNDKFHPIHAIKVCARLLNSSVVKFMSGDVHLSDRALQQYADVHRLLLEMVAEHPNIQQTASKELDDFIQKPWVRGRDMTPDIGNLIQYLTVSDSVSWESFKSAYVTESFRRNARWIDSRFPQGHPRVGPDASDEALIEYWSEGTSVSTKLMLFNVLFLDVVAKPAGKTLADVKHAYDQCWGRLTEEVIDKLKIGALQIGQITTLQQVMARISMPDDIPSIVKLIRWAYDNEKEVPIPEELKKADNTATSQQAYTNYLQQRTVASQRLQLSRVLSDATGVRSRELNSYLLKVLPSRDNANHALSSSSTPAPTPDQWLTFDELWTKVDLLTLPPLLAYLHANKAQGKLIASPSGHTVVGRAGWYKKPTSVVLKEMVFSFGNKTVLVVSSDSYDIGLYSVQQKLGLSSHGSLSTSTTISSATGCFYTSISPFSSACPAYAAANNLPASYTADPAYAIAHTVLNERVMKLGKDTEVYMSGGCENVQLCLTVGEVERLMAPDKQIFSC